MSENFMNEDVKTRLILSGLCELFDHGVRDFSLRRAALAAGVSCAAPYRYFKSKEDYIAAILSYLAAKWELMSSEIASAHKDDAEVLIAALAVANIKFWLSNKNLRSAMIMASEEGSAVKPFVFDKRLCNELSSYLTERSVPENEIKGRINALRALIVGYVSLIGSGELPNAPITYKEIERQIKSFIIQ